MKTRAFEVGVMICISLGIALCLVEFFKKKEGKFMVGAIALSIFLLIVASWNMSHKKNHSIEHRLSDMFNRASSLSYQRL